MAQRSRLARWAVFCLSTLPIVCADSVLGANGEQQMSPEPPSGQQLVVLLDVNPHQRKVLAVERTLAEKIIQKLNQPGNVFSVITFGTQSPVLMKAGAPPADAILAVRGVPLEHTKEKCFSVHLYEAVNLAFGQFIRRCAS